MPDYRPIMKLMCQAHGIPEPLPEHKFHPTRKWKLDFYFHPCLALEIQGGIFTGGRHVRGAALLKEYEKLNECAVAGIRVLFCTPQQLKSFEIAPLIKRALGLNNEGT